MASAGGGAHAGLAVRRLVTVIVRVIVALQVVVGGLLLGAVYALFSSGLTLIWGMMNVVNFAHGDFVMVGMYVAFLAAIWLHASPPVFASLAAALLFVLGAVVYYVADRTPYTTRKVVEAMADALGVKPRFLPLPAFVADLAYKTDQVLSTMGVYAQTVHLVGEANWNVGVSIDKARAELTYAPAVAIEEGMRRAVEWCRARGQL